MFERNPLFYSKGNGGKILIDMKTAGELLKEKWITPETVHHNYAYVYRTVCDIIGEAQKEAYNQALKDAPFDERNFERAKRLMKHDNNTNKKN